MNSSNYVRFDVGHHLFVCHKNTIKRYENCILAKYIEPQYDSRQSENDYIVIDRDGKHFGTILNFMRDPGFDLSRFTDSDLTDIMREADYYCLTELVEACERQFEISAQGEQVEVVGQYEVPAESKLEIIFGLDVMRELLESSQKPIITISYRAMRKFHIDNWIEDLVKLCDHTRFKVYCFANKSGDEIMTPALKDFILSYYEPSEKRFPITVAAPAYDKFRSRRAHYKCKIFKSWFVIQNARIKV